MNQSSRVAVPEHIAVIMDGNGRWAQRRGLGRSAGHQAGVKATRKLVEGCARRGVKVLTVFAFSSENWKRPEQEVSFLMELFRGTLRGEVGKLHENNIHVRFIGDLSGFRSGLRRDMIDADEKTAGNTGMRLNIAVNYGGRWELTRAAQRIAAQVESGQLTAAEVNEELLTGQTCIGDDVEPDLFIRTGGEQRLSNYLLWHLAYTELFFTDTLWPDFGKQELEQAINFFNGRERRFGQTGEQIRNRENNA